MPYPLWSYFPRNVHAPSWVDGFVQVVSAAEPSISTAERKTGLSSDDVLSELEPGLSALGYDVESGKSRSAKIFRPVLFGDNGVPQVSYEVDAFNEKLGVVVEVEAGRGAANNADYRDILRTSLILDADYLALLMPIAYRSTSVIRVYQRTLKQLDAFYASGRLRLPFQGLLLVGY